MYIGSTVDKMAEHWHHSNIQIFDAEYQLCLIEFD